MLLLFLFVGYLNQPLILTLLLFLLGHHDLNGKQKICQEDCLGTVLALIFGMTFSILDDYLLFGKWIIVMLLRNDQLAHVQIPCSKKTVEYK